MARLLAYSLCTLIFGITICKSTFAKNTKGERGSLRLMDEIKKCYKAAKYLQKDPANVKKTSTFLYHCDKFLKEFKITEVQKAALARIGYIANTMVSRRRSALEPDGKKTKYDSKKRKKSRRMIEDAQYSSMGRQHFLAKEANKYFPGKSETLKIDKSKLFDMSMEYARHKARKKESKRKRKDKNIENKASQVINSDELDARISPKMKNPSEKNKINPSSIPRDLIETVSYSTEVLTRYHNPDVQNDFIYKQTVEDTHNAHKPVHDQRWVDRTEPVLASSTTKHKLQKAAPIPDISRHQEGIHRQHHRDTQDFRQPLDDINLESNTKIINGPQANIPKENFQANAHYRNPLQKQQQADPQSNFGSMQDRKIQVPSQANLQMDGRTREKSIGQEQHLNNRNIRSTTNLKAHEDQQQKFLFDDTNFKKAEL